MLDSYLGSLELRLQGIEKLLGSTSEYKESDIKEVKEGISDVLAKVHKDVSRKCISFLIQSKRSKRLSISTRRSLTLYRLLIRSPWCTLSSIN